MTEELQPIDPLSHYQHQLGAYEERARDIALDLEVDEARRSLLVQDGWKKLMGRLKGLLDDQTERLLTVRMDGYQLGQRQGFIRALRILSIDKPLSEQRIAELKEEGRLLVDRIRDLRKLLS